MPTYEYHCEKCKQTFDQFQRITEPALETCPKEKCPKKPWGKGKVKRAVGGGAGLIFKGSGFYITDYRSESYKEAAKKDAPAESKPSGESKPASGSKTESSAPAPAKAETKPKPKKE